jgi:hypothetical protein
VRTPTSPCSPRAAREAGAFLRGVSLTVAGDEFERDGIQDLRGRRLHSEGHYFVLEGGEWKHRFSLEQIDIFMPGTPYEDFVAAQR